MAITSVAKAFFNYILVNPNSPVGFQPQNGNLENKLPNFLFNYEGENKIDLQSSITDHFVEDNSSIIDHIGLSPEKITVEGFVGELNDIAPEGLKNVEKLVDNLQLISAFVPNLSTTASRNYNRAKQVHDIASSVGNSGIASLIKSDDKPENLRGNETISELQALRNKNSNQTKQQDAFKLFYGYWRLRTLFTVQTPWAVFNNMAIESLNANQNKETEAFSTFNITFKIVRFASDLLSSTNETLNLKNRAAKQAAQEVDFGLFTPTSSISLASRLV